MIELALTVSVPVAAAVILAALMAGRRGKVGLWLTLLTALVLSALWWGLGFETAAPFAQRFVAPVSVYGPPLLVAGYVLDRPSAPFRRPAFVAILAAGIAAANVLFAQFMFTVGCSLGIWECL